jgi:uncharacterized protein (DUF2141 family)
LKNRFVTFASILILALHAVSSVAGDEVTLTVVGTDLKSSTGQLVVAVFDSSDSYLKKPVDAVFAPISENLRAVAEFHGLLAGTYAVSAFHDKNSDGKLNTRIAIPRENYGFSNNARSLFGPPSFKKASFEIFDQDVKIEIRVH